MTTYPSIPLREMKRWTVAEYHGLIEKGFLQEGAPFELIDGLLMCKDRRDSGGDPMTIGHRHSLAVDVLGLINQQLMGSGCYIRVQSPVAMGEEQEPEPDASLIRGAPQDFRSKKFTWIAALLVIEVADSSLEFDRTTKQRIYAAAGIPAYWIVNLRHNKVEVYEQPDAQSGEYRIRRDLVAGESANIPLPSGQTISVPVSDLVG